MDEAGLAELAGIVGAGGAALAGFGLLALAEALLAVSIAGTGVLDKAASPAAVGAGAGGLIVVALAAAVFVRFPLLTIPALVVAAPFRPPVDFDREYRLFFALAEGGRLGRLIPLYAVLTASAAAFLYRALRRNEIVAPPRLIAVPTAAFLAFASLSLLWSRDIEAGANLLAFFLLPFAALVAAGFVGVQARDQSIRELTSGRWQRAELTIDVVREQPLIGVGLGAQPKVSRELGAGRSAAREARFVSHTTPLTVAAELGLVGFALYVVLLLAAIRMLALLRETLPTLALALGAVLLALFAHSLAYSGFFEDPITWLTLGVGAAYLAVPAPAREPEPAPADSGTIPSPQPV